MLAIYVRQSLNKKDSISIETQISICRANCDMTADTDIQVFKDKGWSGKNMERPAFRQMMELVDKGVVSKIVVYRLDRLSRSLADFCGVWSRLENSNTEFMSVTERFDTSSPMGKAMLYIIMVFAQLERETIAERVQDNYYSRIKYGPWPGGPAPYGMKVSRMILDDGRKIPTLETTEQIEVVKRIFYSYAREDVSLGKIAKELNEDQIPGPKRGTWDNVSVSRLLHSPVYVQAGRKLYLYYASKGVKFNNSLEEYTGKMAAHIVGKRKASNRKYTNLEEHVITLLNMEGIIPEDIFLQCQKKLENNKAIGNSGAGKASWLSGLIKCGSCGYAIVIRKWKDKKYLGCSGHYNLHKCDKTGFNILLPELEEEISRQLANEINSCREEKMEVIDELSIVDEVRDIEGQIRRLVSSIAKASSVSMKYINAEIERLEERKQSLSDMNQKPMEKEVKVLWSDKLSFDEKKKIARAFIERILVYDDKVEIKWKY